MTADINTDFRADNRPGERRFSNPLALAVLVLLYERPMHPYEMATALRERGKEQSIKLNYGSLYTVIEQLLREKCIAVKQVLREGRRPEKTIYELTGAGEIELIDWMRELVSSPVKEYPQFEAALSLLPSLPPEEVIELLQIRLGLIEKRFAKYDEEARFCRQMNLPRLFSLESEYARALLEAEYKYCKNLLADIKSDDEALASTWIAGREAILKARAAGAMPVSPFPGSVPTGIPEKKLKRRKKGEKS
jgi:DNA-binding PadR family transcriptional regulator